MDAKGYVAILNESKKSATSLMCTCCGVETSSIGQLCVCSNCESMVTTNRAAIESRDHALLDSLDSINKSISDSKYDQAIATYEKLIAERKDTSLMYAAAIANLKYSNYEITQIGYAKNGFMEENTLHRDKAAKLVSTAKKLITKSISLTNAEIAKENTSLNLVYNRFLAQIKISNIKGAKDSIAMLQKIGNEYIYNYANLVFESRMERYDNALKIAQEFTTQKSFSVNAFYYIGLILFKKGKIKDAKAVLEALNGLLKSSNLEALLFEVNAQLSIY
jgi:hypothetical protein